LFLIRAAGIRYNLDAPVAPEARTKSDQLGRPAPPDLSGTGAVNQGPFGLKSLYSERTVVLPLGLARESPPPCRPFRELLGEFAVDAEDPGAPGPMRLPGDGTADRGTQAVSLSLTGTKERSWSRATAARDRTASRQGPSAPNRRGAARRPSASSRQPNTTGTCSIRRPADAVDDPELRLEVIREASVRGHPGEACELIEPYLHGCPDDGLATGIYAEALAKAHAEAEPGERERAALTRYGDRSGREALREAIDAFLGRTEWGATVRKWVDAERSRLEAHYWQAAERDKFDALAVEVAITYPMGGVPGSPDADTATSDGSPVNTPLRAFAADAATPGELAARASEWDRYVRFGIWQVQEPQASPGVWCTELVSGMRQYTQFPAAALDDAAPWSVWLGALVPMDGIWRSTGNGIWLSPLEGDAAAEYAEQAVWHVLQELSGVPRDRLPEPGEIRFGQAEPYCVRWETGEEPEPEFGEDASPVIARLTTVLASRVWWKRSVPVAHNS
jgi:hypothetical protein